MWQIICRCAMAGGILLVVVQSVSAADPDPAQLKKTVQAYISKANQKAAPNHESVEESQIITADLNGDDRAEIILWSTRYGGTYSFNDVTIFTDVGQGYQVAAGTTDALGMVESIEVKNNLIHIHAVWPGPNDPGCCPTVRKTAVYQWQGKTLADVTDRVPGKK